MDIDFKVEQFTDIIEELKPLTFEHWKEIADDKEDIPLNPNYNKYYELEKIGALHIMTARHVFDLVGYNVVLITPHLHYRDTVMALNDVLYIKPTYRKGSVGTRLVKYTEDKLKERGVTKILYHFKTGHDISKLFERLGYVFFEKVYAKNLR